MNGLIGYVPGNRHNYLFELAQALKEAGCSKNEAQVKIIAWAQRHNDEDRRYIVDLVYGA
jgi:predicted AAA+ superfamily ATPase